MTDTEKQQYKKRMQEYAASIIRQRVAEAKLAMDNAQAAANSEEKSSAGDKYETSRAMGHLEKDMHANQLMANSQELAALLNINCATLYDTVSTGCLLVCEGISFFIASGLGRISFEGKDIYFLSPAAPLAKLLFNKKSGDKIAFNNREMLIKEIF